MEKKDNQRTRLTRLLLKNSLIALLQKKPIYQITVSELCSEAELNRSTFYKHYGNVQDILQEIEEETLLKGTQCMREMETAGINHGEKALNRLLTDVQKNSEIYRLLTDNSIDGSFTKKMLGDTVDFFKENMKAAGTENKMSGYVFNYLVAGSISVIQNWLAGPMEETPAEISKLIYNISAAVLKYTDILPEERKSI